MFYGTVGMLYPKQMQVNSHWNPLELWDTVLLGWFSLCKLRYAVRFRCSMLQSMSYFFSPISVESNESWLTLYYMFQCLHLVLFANIFTIIIWCLILSCIFFSVFSFFPLFLFPFSPKPLSWLGKASICQLNLDVAAMSYIM